MTGELVVGLSSAERHGFLRPIRGGGGGYHGGNGRSAAYTRREAEEKRSSGSLECGRLRFLITPWWALTGLSKGKFLNLPFDYLDVRTVRPDLRGRLTIEAPTEDVPARCERRRDHQGVDDGDRRDTRVEMGRGHIDRSALVPRAEARPVALVTRRLEARLRRVVAARAVGARRARTRDARAPRVAIRSEAAGRDRIARPARPRREGSLRDIGAADGQRGAVGEEQSLLAARKVERVRLEARLGDGAVGRAQPVCVAAKMGCNRAASSSQWQRCGMAGRQAAL